MTGAKTAAPNRPAAIEYTFFNHAYHNYIHYSNTNPFTRIKIYEIKQKETTSVVGLH